jgi:hypothetical protein
MTFSKSIPFTLFSSVLFLVANAQTWAPDEAIWRYNFVTLGGRGYIKFTVVKDTIVDNINCKELNKRLYQINEFTGNQQNYSIGNEYTYDTNGVVFIRYYGVFDTLYNFNALPGESWNVPGTSPVNNVCNDISKVQVVDTGHVTINGIYLKQLIVDYHYKNSGSFLLRDTITERIGTLSQYMLPWDLCLSTVDGHEGGELRCYEDATVGEYKHNFFSDCNVTIGIEENELSRQITVYPVPADNILNIDFNELPQDDYTIRITDYLGRTLASANNSAEKTSLNIVQLPNGVYNLIISNSKNELMQRRFIKM